MIVRCHNNYIINFIKWTRLILINLELPSRKKKPVIQAYSNRLVSYLKNKIWINKLKETKLCKGHLLMLK